MSGGWLQRLGRWRRAPAPDVGEPASARRVTLPTAFDDLARGRAGAAEAAFSELLAKGLADEARVTRAEVGLAAARLLQARRDAAAQGLLEAARTASPETAGALADALVAAGEIDAALDLLASAEAGLRGRAETAAALTARRLRLLRRYRGARAMVEAAEVLSPDLRARPEVSAEALRQVAAVRDDVLYRRAADAVGPPPASPGLVAELTEAALARGRVKAAVALSRLVDPVGEGDEADSRMARAAVDALIAAGSLDQAATRLAELDMTPGLALARAIAALSGGDAGALADCLATAVRQDRRRLVEEAPISDLPPAFLVWLDEAIRRLHDVDHWRHMAREAVATPAGGAAMRLTLACILATLNRGTAARGLLRDLAGDPATMRAAERLRRSLSLADERVGDGSADPARGDDPAAATVDLTLAGLAGDAAGVEAALAAVQPGFAPRDKTEWTGIEAMTRGLLALQAGRFDEVRALVAASGAAGRLAVLDATPAPTMVFLGGYGWSGSSAVFDALGVGGVASLAGGGATAHMNAGAETEPVIFDGAWGLKRVWDAVHSSDPLNRPALWNFLRVHALGTHDRSYGEHKGTGAALAARTLMGGSYIDALTVFVGDLADCIEHGDRLRMSATTLAPFHALTGRMARAAAAPTGARTVLVNNGVRAYAIDVAALAADPVFVSVSRDLADQYAEQARSNRYFRLSLEDFLRQQRSRRLTFLRGAHALIRDGRMRAVHDVGFEAFVRDDDVRGALIEALTGARTGSADFDPAASAANIGIGAALSAEDRVRIQTFRQRARTDARTAEGDPFARRPLGEPRAAS